MIKKIFDISSEELKKLYHLKETIEFNNEIFWVEILSSDKPLIKGQNLIYSCLSIYRDKGYEQLESLPIYREVFKETITPEQAQEAMASVRRYPGTYLGNDKNLN